MSYISGETIKILREQKKLTQKQLADKLLISDKTISKWETGRGLPDIGILENLAQTLGVSLAELFSGDVINNDNKSGNMRKMSFYVCPICGNVIQSIGKGAYNCCGVVLPCAEIEEDDNNESENGELAANKKHEISVEIVDNEYYVHMEHEMSKTHYISFICYVTTDRCQMVKLYPEQNVECRFTRRGRGFVYAYCNRHGLFRKMI